MLSISISHNKNRSKKLALIQQKKKKITFVCKDQRGERERGGRRGGAERKERSGIRNDLWLVIEEEEEVEGVMMRM